VRGVVRRRAAEFYSNEGWNMLPSNENPEQRKMNSMVDENASERSRIEIAAESGAGRSFARELRTVGQALERLKVNSFRLERRHDVYLIHVAAPAGLGAGFSLIQYVRDLLRGGDAKREGDRLIELSYSQLEIEHLESQEQAKRADADRQTDPYSPSQILRGVGTFLDARQARSLLEISFKDGCLAVLYVSADGRTEEERQDLEFYYDYWVKMVVCRNHRSAAAGGEPTLYAPWERDLRRHKLSRTPS
jgi:hypothetical protein